MAAASKLLDFVIYTAAPFVLVLGVMIFVHEFGHYLAARLIGVRVLVFKLGFGKWLFRFQRGPTEYGVGLFPIGGYVRLFGDPTEEAEEGEEPLSPAAMSEEEKREALISKSPGQKCLAFFSGPLMNILLSFLLAPFIFLLGEQVVPAVVGMVGPGSPAEIGGLRPGDKIVSVGGKRTASFQEVAVEEALNPNKTLEYVVEREGARRSFAVTLREGRPEPIGESGILPPVPAAVGGVIKGSPAELAGLTVGDKILAVDYRPVSLFAQLQESVNRSGGEPLVFRIRRGSEEQTLVIIPQYREDQKRFMIGIAPLEERVLVRYGPGRAVVKGAELCLVSVTQTYVILWKLLTLQLSPRVMSGPLGIGAITSQAARSGLPALLALTVLIGINLGVLNLLPIPPLDGAHILVVFVEKLLRREINMKYKEMAFRVGMFLLLGLMVLVTVQDFLRYKSRMGSFFVDLIKGLGF